MQGLREGFLEDPFYSFMIIFYRAHFVLHYKVLRYLLSGICYLLSGIGYLG